jgi:hypothetical protein
VRRALLALVLCACPSEDAQPDASGDAFVFVDIDARLEGGSAELGTGTTGFEPLLDDQELGLVAGPQGGYHYIVHSRIREMSPGDYMRPGVTENPVTLFAVYTEDGRQIDKMYPPYHIGYMQDEAEPSLFVLPSGRILQIENAEVPGIYGARVRIRLRVSDVEGRVATDERWVRVVPWAAQDGGP